MTVSKYRMFDGERFSLQFITDSKKNAKKSVENMNKTLTFRMRKYQIVPVAASKLHSSMSGQKTAYAIYGR